MQGEREGDGRPERGEYASVRGEPVRDDGENQ